MRDDEFGGDELVMIEAGLMVKIEARLVRAGDDLVESPEPGSVVCKRLR